MLYLVKQGWTLSQSNPKYGNTLDDALRLAIEGGAVTLESATANGWTGAFMHAWQPGFIEQQYPHWKAHHYQDQWDGTATLRDETWEPMVRHGFFALLAAEVGDLEARDRLLAWADANLAPVREDGTLHYPHDLGRRCTNLTDRTLAMARANVKDGLLRLHQEPFDDEHFAAPYVAAVDFPSVLLRRAIWDAARDALVVTTEPGVPGNGATRFEVRNLAPSRAWIVSVDGSRVARHADAGSIAVEVPLDGRHDVVVQAE
jgi:hypothetical protein